MATKKELIQSIMETTDIYSSTELGSKTNKELSSILSDLDNKEEVVETTSGLNMEEIMREQMQKEIEKMKAEMEEKIKAELESKYKAEAEAKSVSSQEVVTEKVSTRKEIDRYRLVPVMNITNGNLVFVSKKTGTTWDWEKYGDVDEIEFHELQSMKTSSKTFLHEPLLMILDEEIVSHFGLERLYENLLDIADLDDIFKMNNNDFSEFIEKVPKSIVVAIISRARQLVEEEKLDSMWKVKYLNEKFDTDIGQRG